MCADYEVPALLPSGWATCDALTRETAEAIAAHNETGARLFGSRP